ncbi:hypothetical protein R6Q59_010318 [Mikania micrantha]
MPETESSMVCCGRSNGVMVVPIDILRCLLYQLSCVVSNIHDGQRVDCSWHPKQAENTNSDDHLRTQMETNWLSSSPIKASRNIYGDKIEDGKGQVLAGGSDLKSDLSKEHGVLQVSLKEIQSKQTNPTVSSTKDNDLKARRPVLGSTARLAFSILTMLTWKDIDLTQYGPY